MTSLKLAIGASVLLAASGHAAVIASFDDLVAPPAVDSATGLQYTNFTDSLVYQGVTWDAELHRRRRRLPRGDRRPAVRHRPFRPLLRHQPWRRVGPDDHHHRGPERRLVRPATSITASPKAAPTRSRSWP
ncbi:hypothetical protein LP419_14620 [Massilia sp. H-1]|nr:hypothetical protein LP419_14620 [Massilia sp. H-1]